MMSSTFNLDPQAIDAEELRRPRTPMAVYLQEAADVQAFLDKDNNWQRLYDVGLPTDAQSAFGMALAASRLAQSAWVVATRPRKEEEDAARELQATRLRSEGISGCRFSLRDNRSVQGALDRIREGSGLADLAGDCTDVAKLILDNLPAFANDKSFDAPAVANQLAEYGVQIPAATSSRRADSGTAPSLDARDRAFHVLDEILGEVRDAGRHAFRKSNEVARFGSEYERKKNARRRRQKQNVE